MNIFLKSFELNFGFALCFAFFDLLTKITQKQTNTPNMRAKNGRNLALYT